MKRLFFVLLILSISYFSFGITGNEVLKNVENTLTKQKDQESLVEVILYRGDSIKEKRNMKIWASGKEKRVVKFISPETVKGIGVLSLPGDKMYVYLPAYKKVRMIQGTVKDQNFQGTDFSYREIGSFNYSSDFDSQVISEDTRYYTLELIKKPSSDWKYNKVIMLVEKDTFLPKKLEMYENNKLKKVLDVVRTDKKGQYNILSQIKMTTIDANTATEIIIKEVKFDQDLDSKGIFTERFLER